MKFLKLNFFRDLWIDFLQGYMDFSPWIIFNQTFNDWSPTKFCIQTVINFLVCAHFTIKLNFCTNNSILVVSLKHTNSYFRTKMNQKLYWKSNKVWRKNPKDLKKIQIIRTISCNDEKPKTCSWHIFTNSESTNPRILLTKNIWFSFKEAAKCLSFVWK